MNITILALEYSSSFRVRNYQERSDRGIREYLSQDIDPVFRNNIHFHWKIMSFKWHTFKHRFTRSKKLSIVYLNQIGGDCSHLKPDHCFQVFSIFHSVGIYQILSLAFAHKLAETADKIRKISRRSIMLINILKTKKMLTPVGLHEELFLLH